MNPQLPEGTQVLITGATGFTGSVLTRKLVERGFKVRALARSKSRTEKFKDLPVEWVFGQVYDPKVIEQAVKDAAYIFHLVSAFRDTQLPDSEYHKVDVEGTRLLARAALKQKSLVRFLHTSTIGVHGHIEEPPADETYRMKPGDIYQIKKAEAELWIRKFAREQKLPLTVVRPAGIYGPGDERLLKLFKMSTQPVFPLVGRGKHLFHMIHVEDLADFYIHAAGHPKAEGEVFICGDPSPMPTRRIVETVARTYEKSVRFVTVPLTPMLWVAGACEAVFPRLGLKPPLSKRRIGFFTKDRSFNTSKIRNLLGFETVHAGEKGIEQTARWYRDQGWISLGNGAADSGNGVKR